jgi:hypothetical protein
MCIQNGNKKHWWLCNSRTFKLRMRGELNMKKWIVAAAIISVYVAFPAYKYYVLGSIVAYRVIKPKEVKARTIAKGSPAYNRIIGVKA